jgi:tRNA(Ile)-lysidine synthase
MLDPLTIERMAATAGETPILIALSGGGDSLALLHLMVERFGAANVQTVTIDHKLRDGSDRDARRAIEMAADLGVRGRAVIPLEWPSGAKPGQEAARRARYGAMCDHARRVGARVIALGHTRDDQAETVLLRASRGSGWRGLAGMRAFAPAPLWPEGRGLSVARPLLAARRAALRDELRARGATWIEDPANVNEDFARVRARRELEALALSGLEPMRFAALAERLAPHAARHDAAAHTLIEAASSFDAGTVTIRRAMWRGPATVRQRALSVLVAAAGGGAGEAAPEQVVALEAQVSQAGFKGATLAGAHVRGAGKSIVVQRDAGALSGRADGAAPLARLALEANAETVWDRRLALTPSEPGWSVIVEGGAPVLAKYDTRQPISTVSSAWLLEARVAHLLRV